MKTNTVFLLMAEFNTSTIPLNDIAEKYLGLKPLTAAKKADAGQLDIPSFRLRDSNKSPRLVHVHDLAEYIDKRREEAKKELERINN